MIKLKESQRYMKSLYNFSVNADQKLYVIKCFIKKQIVNLLEDSKSTKHRFK